MAKASKKKGGVSAAKKAAAKKSGGSATTGLPAKNSVLLVTAFASPTPKGRKYQVIKTNEVDAYEPVAGPAGVISLANLAAKAPPTGDKFGGTARRVAKLSIVAAPVEEFNDVKKLIESLIPVKEMKKLHISTAATSNRVAQEKRNVHVRAFIYAASREDDNDFHLIVGRSPTAQPKMFMTMELSGLPSANSAAFARLKAARDAYKEFFGTNLPGFSYDFYNPPIPVEIEGSLFYDASHDTGTPPGPKSLRKDMPTIWEVHPISKIVFEP
jgi:hypothetical protein